MYKIYITTSQRNNTGAIKMPQSTRSQARRIFHPIVPMRDATESIYLDFNYRQLLGSLLRQNLILVFVSELDRFNCAHMYPQIGIRYSHSELCSQLRKITR